MMWSWFNGPGAAFRAPLAGSTNYLGAYDKAGRLIRGLDQPPARATPVDGDGADVETAAAAAATAAAAADGQRQHEASRAQTGGPPPETLEDLRPFPLNQFFRSEAVLSEPLKDEIYKRVVSQGQGVREVSMALHVEMSRVAAVVRLKTMEQEWLRQASPFSSFSLYFPAVGGKWCGESTPLPFQLPKRAALVGCRAR